MPMCTAWMKKNAKNERVCFYYTQSDILLCGIARFSQGNKNKLRTFQPQKWKKIKNSQPQTKFLQKKECTPFSQNTSRLLLLKEPLKVWSTVSFRKYKRKAVARNVPYKKSVLRDPSTGVFLRILQNFSEDLFLQKTSGGCFCYLQFTCSITIHPI